MEKFYTHVIRIIANIDPVNNNLRRPQEPRTDSEEPGPEIAFESEASAESRRRSIPKEVNVDVHPAGDT